MLSPIELEIRRVQWIEYISRKYPSLVDIDMSETDLVKSKSSKRIMTDYLKKALSSWTQLKTFNMELVCLSADILQAMDDSLYLDELTVYVYKESYMEQVINLAHSKQGLTIRKLIICDRTRTWKDHQHLVYYLESLSKNNSQLKEIDLQQSRKIDGTCYRFNHRISPSVIKVCTFIGETILAWLQDHERA